VVREKKSVGKEKGTIKMIRFSVLSALLQIPIPSQPLDLGTGIAVDDIALVILETPGDHDQDIPFANPDLLLDLALDPAHPVDSVKTPYPDMIGAHHQFGAGKDLAVPLVRNADPDYLLGYTCLAWLLVGQYINSLLSRSRTSGFCVKKNMILGFIEFSRFSPVN